MYDYLGNKDFLIDFIYNHCTYVQAIANRLARELIADVINNIAVTLNNNHYHPADNPPKMPEFSQVF